MVTVLFFVCNVNVNAQTEHNTQQTNKKNVAGMHFSYGNGVYWTKMDGTGDYNDEYY